MAWAEKACTVEEIQAEYIEINFQLAQQQKPRRHLSAGKYSQRP